MAVPETVLTQAALRRLQAALEDRATARSRDFWTRYLRGAARFRGVPMAGVRAAVHTWWRDEGLESAPLRTRKQAALRLLEEPYAEDQLAGVLLLSERLLEDLSRRDLPAFARLFARGAIADWSLCDWFCVKVLGKMVGADARPLELAQAIGAWRRARPLWQRRAACVAFVEHVPHGDARVPGLVRVVLDAAESLVHDPQRFAQTGVGWTLRELSRAEPRAVAAFAERHAARLSREAAQSLTRRLPAAERTRLLRLQRDAARARS